MTAYKQIEAKSVRSWSNVQLSGGMQCGQYLTLTQACQNYLEVRLREGAASRSLEVYRGCLLKLQQFLSNYLGNSNLLVREIEAKDLVEFQLSLKLIPSKKNYPGATASLSYQNRIVMTTKCFFRYLFREKIIDVNPAEYLCCTREVKRISQNSLRERDIYTLLSSMESISLTGMLYKVFFEVLYSAALRQGEGLSLKLKDVDLENNLIYLREAKQASDRVSFLSQRAASLLKSWLNNYRDKYLGLRESEYVFPNKEGKRIASSKLSKALTERLEYWQALEQKKQEQTEMQTGNKKAINLVLDVSKLSCHLFRRSAAISLLQKGVDLRYVQFFLGHKCIDSTMKYLYLDESAVAQALQDNHPLSKTRKKSHPTNEQSFEAERSDIPLSA